MGLKEIFSFETAEFSVECGDQHRQAERAMELLAYMGMSVPEPVPGIDRRTGKGRTKWVWDLYPGNNTQLWVLVSREELGIPRIYGVEGSTLPVGYSLMKWDNSSMSGRVSGAVADAARERAGGGQTELAVAKMLSSGNAIEDGQLVMRYLQSMAEEARANCLIEQDQESGDVWVMMGSNLVVGAPVGADLPSNPRFIGLVFRPIVVKIREGKKPETSVYNHGEIRFITVPESVPVERLREILA